MEEEKDLDGIQQGSSGLLKRTHVAKGSRDVSVAPWPALPSGSQGPGHTFSTPWSSVLCHHEFLAKTFPAVDFLNLNLN